jgi:hypothetical protein
LIRHDFSNQPTSGRSNLAKLPPDRSAITVDRIVRALAKADGTQFAADAERYRRLAIAALKTLFVPTEAMIHAAHEARLVR